MKMRLPLAVFLCAAAAAPAAAQSKACLQKHPTWKTYDCERVAQKKMWIGMTGEMLIESRGAPGHTSKVTTAGGTRQVWYYERIVGSAFRDGVCVSGCKIETFIVHIGPTLRVDGIEEN